MPNRSESDILADTFESVRALTKFFIEPVKDSDLHLQHEINEAKMNNAFWIIAHLVWTEHFLLIEGLGGKPMDIPWLNEFKMGSECKRNDNWPSIEEVFEKMDEVHKNAMDHVRSLTDEQLNEPNAFNFYFGEKNDKRVLIHHAIRHEPMHAGQLSWISKMNGVKSLI